MQHYANFVKWNWVCLSMYVLHCHKLIYVISFFLMVLQVFGFINGTRVGAGS